MQRLGLRLREVEFLRERREKLQAVHMGREIHLEGEKLLGIYLLSTPFCYIVIITTQFSSVAQSCPTLCDPMNRSTPGLPVHHQLPDPTKKHVHQVGDAIQPSHPLLSLSPPALNLSQHQGLFQ